ncbi:MAG TPA: hypothetical protein VN285_03685 [Candidatus Deferrimicrobium sp.]|nr:hypothetical protein [Candidatus Deferrimicrobium sp.]
MKTLFRSAHLLAAIASLSTVHAFGQDQPATSDTLRTLAPTIYIDCPNCDFGCAFCDQDFFRTEITFVNFVRDRKEADVHILITRQTTGSGGREFTVEFIGQGKYATMTDTLKCFTVTSDTDDKARNTVLRTLKMGLMRYVAKTPLAENLTIGYTKPLTPASVVDKWNYWVFSVGAGGWFEGQKSLSEISLWGEIEASRTTEASKTSMSIWGNYREKQNEYDDSTGHHEVATRWREKGSNLYRVWSLTDHWSAGLANETWASTFKNTDINLGTFAAIEYNVYPYKQSTSRQFRTEYWVGLKYADYSEVTLYGKTSEWLASEKLSVTLELIRPWGTIETTIQGSHFFHDFKKNRLSIYSNLSLRLIEGLSLDLSGQYSYLHDQLSLRRGTLSEEEALTERSERATNYQYWANVSVRYTFGSIYNNIVNPRFGD